ncbi:ankyrin repeat domain-containing protein [uncultured Roseobacter sp.]|uniref:ankyrin repeat domain-containing protein n=1 Tax=uncultured Roseobacter sp. TaxID=114847 RepID=UPI002614AFDE|nr:ankyrin repeat domain-containing protein [uncultured Roseobacter sp.]
MKSLDQLRRDAKTLRKAHQAGDIHARQRIANHPPRSDDTTLKHADYLHVIARENSFVSWPVLKAAVEVDGLDLAARRQRLRIAVFNGQAHVAARILAQDPDPAAGDLALEIALYRKDAVFRVLDADPEAATRVLNGRAPICHLAFSKAIHMTASSEADMLAIADRLVALGADVNAAIPVAPDNDHPLSALYGAIGHANNMPLAKWLLEQGANPNDGESLYHATELGHPEALKMLLEHGADPKGTNALLRAMDFNDHKAVEMLLAAGARADDFDGTHVGGEAPWVVPALHQAARRMSDARMINILLDAGADPTRVFEGNTAYSYARVFGNTTLAEAIEARGHTPDLTDAERLLARAADGEDTGAAQVDPEALPTAYRTIIRTILHLPGKLDHIRRLVALGVEFDVPDTEELTPVQVAGWEGLPDVMAYLLSLGPDLMHQNGYGGSLLSTILHGSENAPGAETRDHAGCLLLALEAGVPVPRRAPDLAGVPELADILADWCEAHPEQVIEGGAI